MTDEYQNTEHTADEEEQRIENPVTETAAETESSAAVSAEIPEESAAEKTESFETAVPETSEEPAADTAESAGQAPETAAEQTSDSPAEPGERDDYFTEEPPKLKYYDEAERQEEINKYKKFKKVDGETYRKVNVFLRKRTYITAREWALARLCADFKTPYGSEMTFIGEHLPELCPFMQEPYSPQAVNQARVSFKRKVRKSAATFLYGAMCGFFTPEELDDILFEANEVSKFFLEIEGTTLELDDEIDIEDKISRIMKNLGSSARTMLKNRLETGSADDEDDDEEDVIEVPVEENAEKRVSDTVSPDTP
ncbi:MAG TPA: DUF5806 family protein [Methanocorpusculum sp.]|nr:DUF5806 family protein [Methanocorpusculum sp.]